jgi:hypothetical protein
MRVLILYEADDAFSFKDRQTFAVTVTPNFIFRHLLEDTLCNAVVFLFPGMCPGHYSRGFLNPGVSPGQ